MADEAAELPAKDASASRLGERSGLSPAACAELDSAGFDILGELGRGGMGVVLRAHEREKDRTVALKVLIRGDDDGAGLEQRFDLEAEVGCFLNHPDIVQIYRAGRGEHVAWIAMEVLSGFSLASAIDDPKFSVEDRVQVLARVALALEYVHENRVLHRDVKPANIFLTSDGRVKLLDFGVAKLADLSLTSTGMVLGTPSYMAPEQVMSQPLSPATDIFSLGVVAFRMFAPVLPWSADNAHALLMAVCVRPPKSFRDVVKTNNRFGLSDERIDALSAVIHRAIDVEPTKRFPSARSFAEALERFLSGEAPEPGLAVPTRAERWSGHRIEWARARAARLDLDGKTTREDRAPVEADALEDRAASTPVGYVLLLVLFGGGLLVIAWMLIAG